jgi:hypothetical protein
MTSIVDGFSSVFTDIGNWDWGQWILFVIGAACLNEWALVHYFAFSITSIPAWWGNIGFAMGFGLASATGIDYESYTYPVHTNRIFLQHGMNLGFAGFFAQVAILAMLMNWEAANFIALVPFLVDVGYFIAVDLPELGAWTGQIQTYIISVGLACVATFTLRQSDMGTWYWLYSAPFWTMAASLFSGGIINKLVWLIFDGYPEFIIADGSAEYADAIFL